MKRRINENYINSIVNRFLNENLEERADELVSRLKTNVNELGGMDDGHPHFGKMNFSKMTPEEIRDMMDDYVSSDEEDEEEDEDDFKSMRGRFFDKEDEESEWSEVSEWSDEELEEGFDDPYIMNARKGEDYSRKEFKKIPKGSKINMNNLRDDSVTPQKFIKNKFDDIDDIFRKHFGDEDGYDDDDDDLVYESEENICECGGNMYEGECMECGKSYMEEDIHDVEDLDVTEEFDYVEEGFVNEMDDVEYYEECPECQGDGCEHCDYEGSIPLRDTGDYIEEKVFDEEGDDEFDYSDKSSEPNVAGCKAVQDVIRSQGGEITDLDRKQLEKNNCHSLKESLSNKQRRFLDKNKNNKIDSEDFKLLRKSKKSETKEGKKFPDLSGDGKVTRKDVLLGRGVKLKESVQLTEDEIIELIENIIKEEQKLKNVGGRPKGYTKYEEVHRKDGKENDEYLKSVAEKMKQYLKDGSKGEYTESPNHFPKGNGQLAKMKTKKYTMSDDGKDFLNDFMSPGMEDLVPEEIEYDEDWVDDNIKGSSRTANNPKWANAEETELGEKLVKKRKAKKFHKAKELAYRKSKQPVTDGTGENAGEGVNIKLESETKEGKVLNEEFNKIQHLMSYNRKTQ
jgi:hypothetical protein